MGRKKLYNTEEERATARQKHWAKYLSKPGIRGMRRKSTQQWQQNNKDNTRLKSANERAVRLQRLPVWANREAIKEFYLCCPEGYHVDHIIPLRGKIVSGLHVIENLQYLTATENMNKSNTFALDQQNFL
jgi:hypothetical protein